VDYQTAENQLSLLQQQGDQIVQGFKGMADKIQAKVPDGGLARELVLDLREAALAVQKQNQSAAMLIEQMAQYIYSLENHAMAPQPGFQPRGWTAAPMPSAGGGFLGNVMTGLGLGAGFGIAEDVVNDIFKAF
jgi:hypothetical protein